MELLVWKMKSIVIPIIILSMSLQLTAQDIKTTCFDLVGPFVSNDLIQYRPKILQIGTIKSFHYCNNNIQAKKLILDGVQVSEEIFRGLGLRQKNVIDSNTYYTLVYNKSADSCIDTIIFFVTPNIPIMIDGEKMNPIEARIVFKKIAPSQVTGIKRKRSFFNKGYIEITTSHLKIAFDRISTQAN